MVADLLRQMIERPTIDPIPALSLLLALLCSQSSFAAPPRPNIIVFLADDHGQLDSTPYGATDVRTPNMQRLADAGMTFTHAFIASPSCAPSRAAMLTGLMPARNGAENNHTYKRDDVASLPGVLRQLGYQTAAFGKVAHGGKDTARHGFDVFDEQHDAAFVAKFLRERDASKPLCLFVGTHHPHVPWPDLEGYDPAQVQLPPSFVDTPQTREFRARYYSAVTKADTRLGEVLDLAKQHFDPANTLILYTADHGAQWPFGKWNLYDSGIRVPLLAAWPGVIQPGSRTAAMVQWIDLWPTLIAAAGGTVPTGIDGSSFLPVLRAEKSAHREVIFTTHSGDGRMNVYPVRAIRTAALKIQFPVSKGALFYSYYPWDKPEVQWFHEDGTGNVIEETLPVPTPRRWEHANTPVIAHWLNCIEGKAKPLMPVTLVRNHLKMVLPILQ